MNFVPIAAEPDFMRFQRQFRAPHANECVTNGILVPVIADLHFLRFRQDAALFMNNAG
jgi:hypothetical protein